MNILSLPSLTGGTQILELDPLDALYVATTLFFQIGLIVHFAVRKWFLDKTIHLWGMDLMRYQIERTQTE